MRYTLDTVIKERPEDEDRDFKRPFFKGIVLLGSRAVKHASPRPRIGDFWDRSSAAAQMRAMVTGQHPPEPGGGYTMGLGDIDLFDIPYPKRRRARRLASARCTTIPRLAVLPALFTVPARLSHRALRALGCPPVPSRPLR
jgi:hypothetical protein